MNGIQIARRGNHLRNASAQQAESNQTLSDDLQPVPAKKAHHFVELTDSAAHTSLFPPGPLLNLHQRWI